MKNDAFLQYWNNKDTEEYKNKQKLNDLLWQERQKSFDQLNMK